MGAQLISNSIKSTFTSPLIQILASSSKQDTFHVLSALGETASCTINPKIIDKIILHKFNPDREPIEYDIETFIQSRDLNNAYKSVAKASKNARQEGKIISRHEAEIIELCTIKPKIDPIIEINSINSSSQEIKQLFDKYSYNLPPGFISTQPSDSIEKRIFDLIILRLKLLIHVATSNYKKILESEVMIINGMETDSTFLDANTIRLIIETIIHRDYLKGLSLGLRFCEIIGDNSASRFSELVDCLHLMLYPTVFDPIDYLPDVEVNSTVLPLKSRSAYVKMNKLKVFVDTRRNLSDDKEELDQVLLANKKIGLVAVDERDESMESPSIGIFPRNDNSRTMLEKYLSDPMQALNMVRLELNMQKLVSKTSTSIDEDVLKLMTSINAPTSLDVPRMSLVSIATQSPSSAKSISFKEITISAHTNRIYHESLLSLNKFEEYFNCILELCNVYFIYLDISRY